MPLLDSLDIDGTVITADALLTQVKFVRYQVEDKKAHYHFTVKANQLTLLEDLRYFFDVRKAPDATAVNQGHGRIETRKIWITSKLNDYLNFPYIGRAFVVERDGPENISRLRRFAIGSIKAVSSQGVAATTRMLTMNVRLVLTI